MVDGKDEPVLVNSGNVSTLQKEKSGSFSSSLSSSSEDNCIQLDTEELDESISGNEHIHRSNSAGEDAQLASGVGSHDAKTTTPNSSSASLDVGNLEDSALVGVNQPPAQMMVRSDVPDPYRIPSSVFARTKSTAPIEWSVASNESLFSIHAENSGYSGQLMFGKSGDLSNFSGILPGAYPPIPRSPDPEAKKADSRNGHKQDAATDEANAESMKDVLRAAAEGHVNKGNPPLQGIAHSSSIPRHSDGSTNSFAFPILTEGSNSPKGEPEHHPNSQSQTKAASHKEAPEVVPDGEQSKWFPCFSCSFCC